MPNIKISDLAPATLPLTGDATFFEVQTVEAGQDVSRKISLDDIVSTTGLDASFVTVGANAQLPNERVLTAGANIAIVDGGPNSTITISSTGLSFPILAPDGTAGAPSYSFASDTDSGIFLVGADILGLSAGGVEGIRVAESGAVITNTIFGRLIASAAGGPALQNEAATFNNPSILPNKTDDDTGIGYGGSDVLVLVAGAAQRIRITGGDSTFTGDWNANTASGPALLDEGASSSNPTIVPNQADDDTGLGSAGADILSLTAGGVEIARATEVASANQFAIAQSGSTSVPDLTSLADSDTGFRWPANNTTVWIGGGSRTWNFSTAKFFSEFSNGPALMNEVSSRTNPTLVPDHADENTGIGSGGGDELSIIAGGLEAIRVSEVAGNFIIQYFGVVTFPTGSASAAAVGFDGDEDTGLFSPGADIVALTAGGFEAVRYAELSSQVIQTNSNQVGLTASVTQTQAGGLALLSSYNEVATVGTTGDALTAFTVVAGTRLIVINNGANNLQLFPAVGDDIGAGVNTAITIAAGELGIFIGRDATNWDTLYNAAPSPSGGGPGGVLPVGTVSEASLKWNGVDAWIEEIQIRLTGGSTGITILDAGGTDNIRIGHDGSNALVRTTGSAEVIFGGGGAGPTTGWRFEQLIRVPDGSAAAPTVTFFGSITTGWFRQALGLSASITGVEQFRISNATTQIFSDDFRLTPNIGADTVRMIPNAVTDPNDFVLELIGLDDIHFKGVGNVRLVLEEFNLAMFEKAAAPADVAGTGQFWVRDDVPNTAMFTNDAGVDKSLVNDAVQARRTTDFTLTTAFADVTLDTTDIETDAAVLEHSVTTDNIIIGQPGTFEVTFGLDIDPSGASTDNIRCFGRVRLNDAGVDLPGSLASITSFEDGSIDGDDFFGRLQCSFIVTLAATDFLTLQLMKVETSGSVGVFVAEEVTVTVKRLL